MIRKHAWWVRLRLLGYEFNQEEAEMLIAEIVARTRDGGRRADAQEQVESESVKPKPGDRRIDADGTEWIYLSCVSEKIDASS